jgi:hypothetical protein
MKTQIHSQIEELEKIIKEWNPRKNREVADRLEKWAHELRQVAELQDGQKLLSYTN